MNDLNILNAATQQLPAKRTTYSPLNFSAISLTPRIAQIAMLPLGTLCDLQMSGL
jgi:hypothetical protein